MNYPEPSSVYVHVPFCRHRCHYCNFALVADRDYLIDQYLDALQMEIALQEPRTVQTVFLGGGTPSHLPANQLERLLTIVLDRFTLADDAEFTCEVNPNDVHQELLDTLVNSGVNRLSIGAQSLIDQKLQRLDRQHSVDSVLQSVELARKNVASISLDLIFGERVDTVASWTSELEAAGKLEIDHISTYELTIEKGTRLFQIDQAQSAKVSNELSAQLYQCTREELANQQFEQYEISSFARTGQRCRHNQSYWNGSRYLAFGPGAASFVGNCRMTNHPSLSRYLASLETQGIPAREFEELSSRQIAIDLLVFGLRQTQGADLRMIESQTGCSPSDLNWEVCENYLEQGLLRLVEQRLSMTESGLLFADSITDEIVGHTD